MHNKNIISTINRALHQAVSYTPEQAQRFFKTTPGSYAEHDRFLGIRMPDLRNIAKTYQDLSFTHLQELLTSPYNETRLLALLILVKQFQKHPDRQQEIFDLYLQHTKHINNWNLVDCSAHYIVGAYLLERNKQILTTLASSPALWERRIAIVSTWYFIQRNQLDWTFHLAKMLLADTHDLMHKATGWMLREAGKKDAQQLVTFLDTHAHHMPRTMLRYSIEKLDAATRKAYLAK